VLYSEDVINRVRDSVDIHDLISGFVTLRKAGRNYVGLCPFHAEKTPSFNVNPEKQIFHCFGCGVGGDIFKFLELQQGLNFPEALRKLADRAGIPLPENKRGGSRRTDDERKALTKVLAEAADQFRRELEGPGGSAARAYLAKRHVSENIVADFGLGYARPEWEGLLRELKQKGYAPALLEKAGLVVKRNEGEGYYDRFRGRIIFPIRDINGTTIAFGGRVLDDSLPKYLNSPETPLYSKSNVLYGMDRAREAARKHDHFIIVEGYLDAIACHQHGVRNAVATLGTALTEGHLRLMRRFTRKLKLIFDPDQAGVQAALRSFDLLADSGMNVKVVSLPGGDDPDTFLTKQGHDAFTVCLKEALPFMDFILGQVLKSGGDATIAEKVERAGEMLGFIAKLSSSIERDHYLKKTAEALDVDEAVLRQDMAQHRAAPVGPRERASVAVTARVGQRPKAEEMLIHLMLRDQAIARRLRVRIDPEDFTDPLFRRVVARIFELLDGLREITPRTLTVEGDAELNQLISHYAVLETDFIDAGKEGEMEKTCADCVDRIKQQGSSKKMKTLLTEIQAAESRGDRELLRVLQEQLVTIKRGAARDQ
jgi:DNA primase